jgi:hypothetical protein
VCCMISRELAPEILRLYHEPNFAPSWRDCLVMDSKTSRVSVRLWFTERSENAADFATFARVREWLLSRGHAPRSAPEKSGAKLSTRFATPQSSSFPPNSIRVGTPPVQIIIAAHGSAVIDFSDDRI